MKQLDHKSVLNINRKVVEHMRRHFVKEHSYLVQDAKTEVAKRVRQDFCDAFNVILIESHADESGCLQLEFPLSWSEGAAEKFASQYLDLDLSNKYGGPGRYFQSCSTTKSKNALVVSCTWGMDI